MKFSPLWSARRFTASKLFRGVLPFAGILTLIPTHGALAQTPAAMQAETPDTAATTSSVAQGTLVAREILPSAAFSSSSLPEAPEATAPEPPLPDNPLPQYFSMEPKPKAGTDPAAKIADKRTLTIPDGWHAQPLTAKDKVILGAEDLYAFESIAGIIVSAGYSHALNSAPNYGTDKGAFGERLGAAGLREWTQLGFSEIVLDPVLHEDPRYYVQGPRYDPVHRTLYAITRPLVTQNDNGKHTVNAAMLLGYAASAAITPAYYPQMNRNFRDVASVYGGSLGGAALGFFLSEFSGDFFRAVHLKQ